MDLGADAVVSLVGGGTGTKGTAVSDGIIGVIAAMEELGPKRLPIETGRRSFMLDGYGLHSLVWDAVDERFGDVLVASPADASGRGIALSIRQNGAAANMTGAT